MGKRFNVQMAQYSKPTIEGENTLTLENNVKSILPHLEIDGNTFQQRYDGYNLFNINNYNVHSLSLRFDISHLVIGKKYTLTSNNPLSWFKISTQQEGYNSVIKYDTTNGFTTFTFTMTRNSNISETSTQYLMLGGLECISSDNTWGVFTDSSQLVGYEIQIVEGTEKKTYEPYVGGISAPNPNYPQDIINAGDNGINVKLRGKNLWYRGDVEVTSYMKPVSLTTPLLPGTYVLSADVYSNDTDASTCLIYDLTANKGLGNIKRGNRTYMKFTLTEPCKNIGFYASNNYSNGKNDNATFKNIQIELDTAPTDYEPYFKPTTIQIPSEVTLTDGTVVPLRFAKVDDVADTLIVDNVSKKVTYQQKIYGAEITPSFSIVSWYKLNSSIDGLSHGVSVWSSKYVPQTCSRQKGYCTHGPVQAGWQAKSGDIIVGVNSYAIYFMGLMDIIGVTADWVDRENPTTEEKNAGRQACVDWFAEHKPYIEYVLPTPIEYDLTETNLGRELLNIITDKGTNILEISNAEDLAQTFRASHLTHK